MKKFVAFALVLFVAAPAFAQSSNMELYAGAGVSVPTQPSAFSDYWSLGYNVGTGAGYVLNERVSFTGTVAYNNFSFAEDDFLTDNGFATSGINIDGGAASIVSVTANAKFALAPHLERVSPYALGGVGWSNFSIDDVTITDTSTPSNNLTVPGNSESAFGVMFGGGVDIPASPTMAVFIEAQYAINFTDVESTQYVPFRAGMKFRM
jgi:opacity protein-like surface antigen